MPRRVVVIGAGIVGAALAAELAVAEGVEVTVIERGPENRLLGSTGHAPGVVGLLGETAVLTELARSSAEIYETLEHSGERGFDRVGGLEVATSAEGMALLARRAQLAAEHGLPAALLDRSQSAALASHLVDPGRCLGGVFYERDGTARATVITAALRERAARAGAHFVYDSEVTAIDVAAARVRAVRTGDERVVADDVVVACGIWGPEVAALAGEQLWLVPVEHPYVFGSPHPAQIGRSPFVRWPEHCVYARDHGDRLGLGSYDHDPLAVEAATFGNQAERPWQAERFEPAIARGLRLLPPERRFHPAERLNGVFAITPDNLPLLGASERTGGLWFAEALWITHAAGAAHVLARAMLDEQPDIESLEAVRPGRFVGRSPDELAASALRLYNDIYAAA
jgi:glycine/D-amino acid oxidase-like deaminating enzyme